MIKVVALMGKAGSGKDYTLSNFLNKNKKLHKIIQHTTRPIREKEIDGKDYHFITKEEFNADDFVEYQIFNDWYYGTHISSLDENKTNIGIFSPRAIRQLLKSDCIDLTVFWITAKDKTRLLRQLYREEDPDVKEIIRRYSADELDFENIDFKYYEIRND